MTSECSVSGRQDAALSLWRHNEAGAARPYLYLAAWQAQGPTKLGMSHEPSGRMATLSSEWLRPFGVVWCRPLGVATRLVERILLGLTEARWRLEIILAPPDEAIRYVEDFLALLPQEGLGLSLEVLPDIGIGVEEFRRRLELSEHAAAALADAHPPMRLRRYVGPPIRLDPSEDWAMPEAADG